MILRIELWLQLTAAAIVAWLGYTVPGIVQEPCGEMAGYMLYAIAIIIVMSLISDARWTVWRF